MTITDDTTTTINHASKTFRQPSDRADALRWLDPELARDLKADRARHRDVIWQLLIESIETIDRTPDQERRWLTSGKRSNWTHSTGLSHADLIALERVRLLSAMKPYDSDQATYLPQRDEERAMGVLDWMRWVRAAKSGDRSVRPPSRSPVAVTARSYRRSIARTASQGPRTSMRSKSEPPASS